jgi:hypothetical protein
MQDFRKLHIGQKAHRLIGAKNPECTTAKTHDFFGKPSPRHRAQDLGIAQKN